MKNTNNKCAKMRGVLTIAIAAVIGLSFAACGGGDDGGGGGPGSLEGTWEGSMMMNFGSGDVSTPVRLVLNGNNWAMTIQNDDNNYVDIANGTFAVSGSNVTFTIANYRDGSGMHSNAGGTIPPMNATWSGNTLTMGNGTLTKTVTPTPPNTGNDPFAGTWILEGGAVCMAPYALT